MRALYDSKSKTIDDRGIKELFSQEAKYKAWLEVEAVLAEEQSKLGIIPKEAGAGIRKAAKLENIDLKKMDEIYKKIGHGFVPFIKVLTEACDNESSKYVHYGVTTQNIQQSSQMLIMKEIHNKFLGLLDEILINLSELAKKYNNSVMAGRTHGQHALPITYGYKVSVWISELLRAAERLQECEKRVFSVMMGGAIGSFNSFKENGPELQDNVARRLNMYSMDIPSRNIGIYKSEYMMNLSLLASSCHKMAEEVYYGTSEEFREVSEPFKEGTVGSSTMPQKVNPKLAKGIIANSQKLYNLGSTSLFSAPRLFEGDSSSYMLYDGLLDEALQCTTEILLRMEELTRLIVINDKRMEENLNLSKGLINSEHLMMRLAERVGKDKAHELCYDLAMATAKSGKKYIETACENEYVMSVFTKNELEEIIAPESYIGECSKIATDFSEKAIRYVENRKKGV